MTADGSEGSLIENADTARDMNLSIGPTDEVRDRRADSASSSPASPSVSTDASASDGELSRRDAAFHVHRPPSFFTPAPARSRLASAAAARIASDESPPADGVRETEPRRTHASAADTALFSPLAPENEERRPLPGSEMLPAS